MLMNNDTVMTFSHSSLDYNYQMVWQVWLGFTCSQHTIFEP